MIGASHIAPHLHSSHSLPCPHSCVLRQAWTYVCRADALAKRGTTIGAQHAQGIPCSSRHRIPWPRREIYEFEMMRADDELRVSACGLPSCYRVTCGERVARQQSLHKFTVLSVTDLTGECHQQRISSTKLCAHRVSFFTSGLRVQEPIRALRQIHRGS